MSKDEVRTSFENGRVEMSVYGWSAQGANIAESDDFTYTNAANKLSRHREHRSTK